MTNIGVSTKWKAGIGSDKLYRMKERCYSCNARIYWETWKEVKVLHEDKPYCRRCYEQVTHGVQLAPYEKHSGKKTCNTCGKEINHIGKIRFCEEHMPEYFKRRMAYSKEIRTEAKKAFKKTHDTNTPFNQRDHNLLRSDFVYCQKCTKVVEKKKAYKAVRYPARLVMCSWECADAYRKDNSKEIWRIQTPRVIE